MRSRERWRRRRETAEATARGGWSLRRQWRERGSLREAARVRENFGKQGETEEETEGMLFIAGRGRDRLRNGWIW